MKVIVGVKLGSIAKVLAFAAGVPAGLRLMVADMPPAGGVI